MANLPKRREQCGESSCSTDFLIRLRSFGRIRKSVLHDRHMTLAVLLSWYARGLIFGRKLPRNAVGAGWWRGAKSRKIRSCKKGLAPWFFRGFLHVVASDPTRNRS